LDLHESGNIGYALKRTSIAIGFRFFNFSSEYLKRLQSYELLHTKMNLTSCLFGSRFVWNPFFLLAGALLFDEKIRQNAALQYFGMDCGMLEFFTHEPQSKEQLMSLLHFWSKVRRRRSRFVPIKTVIRRSRRIRGIFVFS
jgi:hypothetical protein